MQIWLPPNLQELSKFRCTIEEGPKHHMKGFAMDYSNFMGNNNFLFTHFMCSLSNDSLHWFHRLHKGSFYLDLHIFTN